MSTRQIIREYVKLVAENGPIAPRLRALKSVVLPHGEREAFATIVDEATKRVCDSDLQHFVVDAPDWPSFAVLVHHKLDAARQQYKKQTGWEYLHDGERTRAVNEPSRMLERAQAEEVEQHALDIQAAENAAFLRAVDEWAQTLTPKKYEVVWRRVWGFSYEQIRLATCNAQGRRGASENIIKPLHDKLTEIANRYVLTDTDGLPYTDLNPLPARPEADDSGPEDSTRRGDGAKTAPPLDPDDDNGPAVPDQLAGPGSELGKVYCDLDQMLQPLMRPATPEELAEVRAAAAAVDKRAGTKEGARIDKAGYAELIRHRAMPYKRWSFNAVLCSTFPDVEQAPAANDEPLESSGEEAA
jgi:hypothetical protein